MVGRVLLTEAKLVLVNEVVFINELFNTIVHDSFKYFADVRKKRDGPIVSTFGFVVFLEDSTD